MKRSVKKLVGCVVRATDGDIGTVQEFYFDDLTWTVRYMVVETGSWLINRKVLISPMALGRPEPGLKVLPVNLTREQVRGSPDIDTAKPVSRQHETVLHGYYGWPYWGMSTYVNSFGVPPILSPYAIPAADKEAEAPSEEEIPKGDPNLRSTAKVAGYHIEALDGGIDMWKTSL